MASKMTQQQQDKANMIFPLYCPHTNLDATLFKLRGFNTLNDVSGLSGGGRCGLSLGSSLPNPAGNREASSNVINSIETSTEPQFPLAEG